MFQNFFLPGARRALIHVPGEPVRALAFLAAVARAVDAWRMSTTAAVGERSRRKGGGSPAVRTRPLFALLRPTFAPRLLQRLLLPTPIIINFFCFNEVFFGVAQVPLSPPSTKGPYIGFRGGDVPTNDYMFPFQ